MTGKDVVGGLTMQAPGVSFDPRMTAHPTRVFISYRRDDAAGYAGRLEEALERRFGRGSVFRDVLDIPPGADFAAAIRARLAQAQAVVVLIGPRWAGGNEPGARRIDDPADFVRLEVVLALESGVPVLPLLLPGATLPAEALLPLPLQPLLRRQALGLSDAHWDADMNRLALAIGLPPRRQTWRWVVGGVALLALAGVGAWQGLRPAPVSPTAMPPADALLGPWQAEVRYAWGDRHTERFEFKRHAGQITGTATFLAYPRAIENLVVDGSNLRFETRTMQSMGGESREVTHRYTAELLGAATPEPRLSLRLHSTGGFENNPPLEFEARRSAAAAAASAPR
jgi:hypothetical protein